MPHGVSLIFRCWTLWQHVTSAVDHNFLEKSVLPPLPHLASIITRNVLSLSGNFLVSPALHLLKLWRLDLWWLTNALLSCYPMFCVHHINSSVFNHYLYGKDTTYNSLSCNIARRASSSTFSSDGFSAGALSSTGS